MRPAHLQILRKLWHASRIGRIHQLQLGAFVGLLMILSRVAWGLMRFLAAGSGSWKAITVWQFSYYGLDYMVVGLLTAIAGIILVYKADALSVETESEPIKDLIKCVEATATGDLSRRPSTTAAGDIGQLSQGIGRLIGVLERSENQIYHLATLIENSSEAVISHTVEGDILTWNKGAQRIYGYSLNEVEGKPIMLLSPLDQGAEIQRQVEAIRQGNRPPPFETIHCASNGRTVKALVRVSPILDSTRELIAISFCAQELTDAPLHPQSPSVESAPEDVLSPEADHQ